MSPYGSTPTPSSIPPQNGNAIATDSGSRSRQGQFSRQGSSYGPGHVHHMAVMVAPIRVDYSFNRGGLKSWIVLIVFILMATSILTIFEQRTELPSSHSPDKQTSEEGAEQPDEQVTVADEANVAEETEHVELPLAGDRDELPGHEPSYEEEPNQLGGKPPSGKAVAEQGDTRPELEEVEEEEVLLSRLRKKVVEREKNRKWETRAKARLANTGVEEQQPPPKTAKRGEEQTTVMPLGEEEEQDDITDKPTAMEATKYHKSRSPPGGGGSHKERRAVKSWHESMQSKQLSANGRAPRKGLLKQNKHKKPRDNIVAREDVEEDDEHESENPEEGEEGDGEIDEETEEITEMYELTSTRKRSGGYDRKAITSRDDYRFRTELDAADHVGLEKHDFDTALRVYDRVIAAYSDSPRAHFGKGRVYQLMSELDPLRAEEYNERAIEHFQKVVSEEDEVPDELFRLAADRLIDCARFSGNLQKVLNVQRLLVDKFPSLPLFQVHFAVTLVAVNRVDEAREVLERVLEADSSEQLAQAYYGLLLKVYEGELESGVAWMRRAIAGDDAAAEEVTDAKFYYHLGDGLMLLGREAEARDVYRKAVALGIFPSIYQRPVHTLHGLKARAWWNVEQSGCGKQLRKLERQWTIIREEALNAWTERESAFADDRTYPGGSLKELVLWSNRRLVAKNCRLAPQTCELLEEFAGEAACLKGEIKLSVLRAGARTLPRCGPTSYELEAHLGLVTPSEARLRVATETRGWKAGKVLLFSNSFEHELSFEGAPSATIRIVLSCSLWHPDVPNSVRSSNRPN